MLKPSRYRIFAIGKIKKNWIQQGIETYIKRLPGLTITEFRDSNPQKESAAMHSQLKHDEIVIALSEEGENLASVEFSQLLEDFGSQRITFLIGGANGLTREIKNSAYLSLSLSSMTFPHEIARLLLIEQIYRAFTIAKGSPYHRISK